MKANIQIEQFDNGITIKWKDAEGEHDQQAIVALERDKEMSIGKTIWEDIKMIMDSHLCNAVEMEIEYKPIKEQQ